MGLDSQQTASWFQVSKEQKAQTAGGGIVVEPMTMLQS